MSGVLVLGVGAVGSVIAHKAVEYRHELGRVTMASRTLANVEALHSDIRFRHRLGHDTDAVRIDQVDAMDTKSVVDLITRSGSRIVLNAASASTHLSVMEACLSTGAAYIDTAAYEHPGEENAAVPWYQHYEWALKPRFNASGVTAVLSAGFDPGVTNAFCSKARTDYFDEIETIDIVDVNAGSHGRYFATNFNAVSNLRNVNTEVVFWERGGWKTVPPHSRWIEFEFPRLGRHKLYSVGHDEIHSLFNTMQADRIEFWMGFSDHYLTVFGVLKNLGLLSSKTVGGEEQPFVPLEMLGRLLPDPKSLASTYSGEVCIGCLVAGKKDGKRRVIFLYSECDHEACYSELGAQAIAYTAGVPAVAAALCVNAGPWDVRRMANVEELDPAPFLHRIAELGIPWHAAELSGDFALAIAGEAPRSTNFASALSDGVEA